MGEWQEIEVLFCGAIDSMCCHRCYVLVREVDEERLVRNVIDRYVFQNSDYFICLESKQNTYILCREMRPQAAVPRRAGKYSREMELFADRCVVDEDRGRFLRETGIGRVLEELEKSGNHTFCFGSVDERGDYSRKMVQYMYYDSKKSRILMSQSDITQIYREQKSQEERLKHALEQAKKDYLTGLYNKQTIGELVTELIDEGKCRQGALLFVDLDDFKLVNDSYGHLRGDQFLKSVADTFRCVLRTSDLVGRVGGDEFVIFLPDVGDGAQVEECAERLCTYISAASERELDGLTVSCSIGIARFPRDGAGYQKLLSQADRAVYASKRKGKNCYSY